MNKRFLEGTRNFISENGEDCRLEYFLLEKKIRAEDEVEKILYGIEIIKKRGKSEQEIRVESEEVNSLTYQKEGAQYILNKLIGNIVTPVTMVPIIDELIVREPCIIE